MRCILILKSNKIIYIKPITKITKMLNSSSNYFIEKDIATIKAIPLEDLLTKLKHLKEDERVVNGYTYATDRMDDFIEEAKAFLSLLKAAHGPRSAKKMPISKALGGDKVKKGKLRVHALTDESGWAEDGYDWTDDEEYGIPLRVWFREFFVTWFYCIVSRWNVINGLNGVFEFTGSGALEAGMTEVKKMMTYAVSRFPFQLEGNNLNKEGEADGLGCTIVTTSKGKAVQWKLPGFNGNMFAVRDAKYYYYEKIASQIARLITVDGKPLNVIITVDGGRGNNVGQSNTLTIRGGSVIKKYANDREKRRTIISSDCHGKVITYVAGSSSGSSKRKAPLTDVEDVTEEMREREKEKRAQAEQNTIVLDGAGSNSNSAKRRKVSTTSASTTTTTTTTTTTGSTGSTPATPASAPHMGPLMGPLIEKVLRSGEYYWKRCDMYAVVTSGEHSGKVCTAEKKKVYDPPARNLTYAFVSREQVKEFLETLRECRVYRGVLAVSACVFEGEVFYDTLKIHVEEKVHFPIEGHGRFLSSFLQDQKRFIQKKPYDEDYMDNILADPQIFFLLQVQQENGLLYLLKQNPTAQWKNSFTSGLMMVHVERNLVFIRNQAREYVWHNASTDLMDLEDATEEFGGSVTKAIDHFKKVKESTRIVRVFSKSRKKWFANVSAGQRMLDDFKEL